MGENQPVRGADECAVILGPDGHFEDATRAALELLGLSLEQLRGRSPRGLLAMADAESEALSETWRAPVAKAAAGEATLVRPDGAKRRVRFVLMTLEEGRYKVTLQLVDSPSQHGLLLYEMPQLLAAWRAAERRLDEQFPGTPEWTAAAADTEAFRQQYLRLFESKSRASGGT